MNEALFRLGTSQADAKGHLRDSFDFASELSRLEYKAVIVIHVMVSNTEVGK